MKRSVSITTRHAVATTYEEWMKGEGIPIIEALAGVEDVKELERKTWDRTAGKGAFIYLTSMKEGGITGMYVMEIPPGTSLNPEKHLYEELTYILEGQGATEVWQEGHRKESFEWTKGALFAAPLNTWHRFHNVGRQRALFISVTTAPMVMDLFHNPRFVFNTNFVFEDRYCGETDYFKVGDKMGRGQWAVVWDTNFIPDVTNTVLTPSNRAKAKSEGGQSVVFEMSENILAGHISEWPVGVYHKAHYHRAGAILLGLKSEGYVLLWPKNLGPNPFKDGHGDKVIKLNWREGAVYCPPDGWFHQHFNTGAEPARHIAFRPAGTKYKLGFHYNEGDLVESIKTGGTMIEYEDEDPAIRRDFEEALRETGIPCRMPASGIRAA